MSDEALKPCPFCGEQCAALIIDQGDKWAHYEPSCLEVRTGYDLSDDAAWIAEAITAWNTRVETLQADREKAAAEERAKIVAWLRGFATNYADDLADTLEANEDFQLRLGHLRLGAR